MIASQIKRTNTIVYCRLWAETIRFYRDVMGLEVAFQNDWFVEFALTDSACLGIADQSRTTMSSAAGRGLTLSFQIADIESVHQSLIRKGLTPTAIRPDIMEAQVFYLHDPEGTRIEFWRPNRSMDDAP